MSWTIAETFSTSPRRVRPRDSSFRLDLGVPFDAGALNLRSARPNIHHHSSAAAAAYDDSFAEKMPFFIKPHKSRRFDLSNSIFLCSVVSLWVLIATLVGFGYWSLSTTAADARDAMKPYFEELVNHTVSILRNVDSSSIGAHEVVDGARAVTNSAVPALQTALNQSALMITRLEALARNPVLQISMGTSSPH